MIKFAVLFIWAALLSTKIWAQSGCTDPKAENYSASSTINDGSCTYPQTSVSLTNPKLLPSPALNESSGLIYTDGNVWTHNDSGNQPAIYRIDESDGSILQTVTITNATNTDWEDITADDDYIYVGDFGNNATGIRTDLTIYRISKSDITAATTVNVNAAIINFNYNDQVIGSSPGANNTAFDCEAFFIKDNVLHLFTKDWVNGHTKHYTLPATPGTHSISATEPFMDVNGLITSADISDNGEIVLVGYADGSTEIFMYLLYDYNGDNFFSGNKRRLDLGLLIDPGDMANSKGQVEAVTFTTNGEGYISAERIGSPFNIPARLYSFSVSNLLVLPVTLQHFTVIENDREVQLKWQTSSEINSSFFSIERSDHPVNFREIGRLTAKGHSNSVTDYQYTDRQPFPGLNYYRLKQVDNDGAEKIYPVKVVKTSNVRTKLNAYLQSSDGNTLILDIGQNNFNNLHYRIISITGSILKNGRISSKVQPVNITSLPKGSYIVVFNNGEKAKFQKR